MAKPSHCDKRDVGQNFKPQKKTLTAHGGSPGPPPQAAHPIQVLQVVADGPLVMVLKQHLLLLLGKLNKSGPWEDMRSLLFHIARLQ